MKNMKTIILLGLSTILLLIIFISPRVSFAKSVIFKPKHDIETIIPTSLELFAFDVGRFPTTKEGLQALVDHPSSVSHWSGPYIDSLPQDLWGNSYIYRCPGNHLPERFDLYCLGADGKTLTDGDDPDDINNWNPNDSWHAYYNKNPGAIWNAPYYRRQAALKRWQWGMGIGILVIVGGIVIVLLRGKVRSQ